MTSTNIYRNLNEFLAKHSIKNSVSKNAAITHTRIPSKELAIFGGSYNIPDEDVEVFEELYYNHIFINKNKEYLTEKQLDDDNCCMCIDLDFRYSTEILERPHTKEHIIDIISLYLDKLKLCFKFTESTSFDVFIHEKPHINKVPDKSVTKDGIHIVFALNVPYYVQSHIRECVLKDIEDAIELPLVNNWDSVLDEGITRGSTNWQLYGSCKPGNETYELTNYFMIGYDTSDDEFIIKESSIENFNLKRNYHKLSIRNKNIPKYEILESIKELSCQNIQKKKYKKTNKVILIDDEEDTCININDIKNKEDLQNAIDIFFKDIKPSEFNLLEYHQYTDTLPKEFYEPGSHIKNYQVAFALKCLDDRMFLSWINLRSKASDFDYKDIPRLSQDWKNFGKNNRSGKVVTHRSILYWSKQYAYEEYEKVKLSNVNNYIEEAINSESDFDIAIVLYHLFKDKYICVSLQTKGGLWYIYRDHRWHKDSGLTLRKHISTTLFNILQKKLDAKMSELTHYTDDEERKKFLQDRVKKCCKLLEKFKKTNDKNNILREAMEIFYDPHFLNKVDSNRNLLAFTNGVIDFETNTFRTGYPQDYITLCTNIPYIEKVNEEEMNLVISFMNKIFPIPELLEYVWNHLAGTLIGGNINQTFTIYHGNGSNGKSILIDMMSCVLGDYKGGVPLSVITEKRPGIGGTSSEIMALKGLRYAVMQEPSKEVRINEGPFKELTGGDPITGRQLYCETQTIRIDADIACCTNSMFDMSGINDDGSWRRMAKVDCVSKFVDNENMVDENKFIFLKDKQLKDKLPQLAEMFANKLVSIAFKTKGIVVACDYVKQSTLKYRHSQDHIASFVNENIISTGNEDDTVKKKDVWNEFKLWFQAEQGNSRMPKGHEINSYIDKKYGEYTRNGWKGIKINIDSES